MPTWRGCGRSPRSFAPTSSGSSRSIFSSKSESDGDVKQKVLVGRADAACIEVLAMRLTAMGFDVIATSDPRRALEATDAGRFDLALLDLRMEPTDGMRLMEGLHERQPRLPVLIMTAHGTIQTAVEAVRRGAFDYLTKPFVRSEEHTSELQSLRHL